MLQAIRDRAQGIFAWVMLILIGVPFALWGIQNYFDSSKEQPAAVVGDREFFDRDVSRVYEQSLANLVDLGDVDEKQLRKEAVERLVREEVIAQAADSRKFAAGDDDVRGFIQSMPFFQTDGKFDKERYKVALSAQGLNPALFSEQVRRSLVMQQFQRGIVDSAFLTQDQADTLIRLSRQEREFDYLTIPIKKSDRSFSDAEIEAYYKEHLADFRNPERVSAEYLMVSLAEIAKGIQPTEEELHKLYEEQKGSFTVEERRRVSHILIPVDGTGEDADKKAAAKAAEIRERLAKGEDFGKLAKETSGDPASASKGGDLGMVSKVGFEPAFADAAYALKLGEYSVPVKTSFGYHLIKVTELTPSSTKPFEEVRLELLQNFQRNAAESKFYELGQKLTEMSFEHPDSLDAAAKALNLTVASTGWFTRDAGEGLASEPRFRDAAFSEDVLKGRNSEPVELEDSRAVVLRVKDHEPASDKPLAEVKDSIIATLRTTDAQKQAQQLADSLLKRVQAGESLAAVAKDSGASPKKSGPVRRDATSLGAHLIEKAFSIPRPANGSQPTAAIAESDSREPIIVLLTSVKDGSTSGVDAKEIKEVRDGQERGNGQRQFGALANQLREVADVKLKPDS